MECKYAQTRPWSILSSERVLGYGVSLGFKLLSGGAGLASNEHQESRHCPSRQQQLKWFPLPLPVKVFTVYSSTASQGFHCLQFHCQSRFSPFTVPLPVKVFTVYSSTASQGFHCLQFHCQSRFLLFTVPLPVKVFTVYTSIRRLHCQPRFQCLQVHQTVPLPAKVSMFTRPSDGCTASQGFNVYKSIRRFHCQPRFHCLQVHQTVPLPAKVFTAYRSIRRFHCRAESARVD